MKHRHDREYRARRRKALHVRQRDCIGMQKGRPVTEEHALRIAGRTRCVAKRRGGVFVEFRPVKIVAFGPYEILVAQQSGQCHLRQAIVIGHRHPVLDTFALRCELLDQSAKAEIEEHDLVLGMPDDVGELIVEKPRIDRMRDRAHAGNRVIKFEVTIAIPGKRRDPVARLDTEPRQGAGEAPRTRVRIAIGVAMDRPLDGPRHDLGVTVIAVRVPDQRRDQERHLHHETLHKSSSGVAALGVARATF